MRLLLRNPDEGADTRVWLVAAAERAALLALVDDAIGRAILQPLERQAEQRG